MKKIKKAEVRGVLIEETFEKKDGKVYWVWRFQGEEKWRRQLTPYKEIPYVKLKNTKS